MIEKAAFAMRENFDHVKTNVGFWIYLMTDCILFGALFATFVVLRGSTAGGPSGNEIFQLPMVLLETIFLLTSSLSAGLAFIALRVKAERQALGWLAFTFVLGAAFLFVELSEFVSLISEGHGWQQSAFLSSFFTLVATHGLHITIGLIWLTTLAVMLLKKGITTKLFRQISLFTLFWHFLDLVWIFIFTIVYLMGVAS